MNGDTQCVPVGGLLDHEKTARPGATASGLADASQMAGDSGEGYPFSTKCMKKRRGTTMRTTPRLLLILIVFLLLAGCRGPCAHLHVAPVAAPVQLDMATFDSGFGGFFTAKSMADQAAPLLKKYDVAISVTHYGDTKNAPYGDKSPAEIARLAQLGVEKALDDDAGVVVIACNTASTQHHAVVEGVNRTHHDKGRHILSIITPTISAVKEYIDSRLSSNDSAVIAIFATPATVKSMTYPTKLADSYQGKLQYDDLQEFRRNDWKDSSRQVSNFFSRGLIRLPEKKTIFIYQFAPGNWVGMIEEGAVEETKRQVVQEDVRQFLERLPTDHKLDVVGFFCTHYPVFKDIIKNETTLSGYANPSTRFIEQGDLAARYAYEALWSRYADSVRNAEISEQELKMRIKSAKPKIVLSGDNVDQTKKLVKTIFPELKDVIIIKDNFAPGP